MWKPSRCGKTTSTPRRGAQCFGGTRRHRGDGNPHSRAIQASPSRPAFGSSSRQLQGVLKQSAAATVTATNQFPTTTTHIRGRRFTVGICEGKRLPAASRVSRKFKAPSDTSRVTMYSSANAESRSTMSSGARSHCKYLLPLADRSSRRTRTDGSRAVVRRDCTVRGSNRRSSPASAVASALLRLPRVSSAYRSARAARRSVQPRHRLQARRSKLDCQRQPFHLGTDSADNGVVCLGQLEAGQGGDRPRGEQAVRVGSRQRRQPQRRLAADAQCFPARCEDSQIGTYAQQRFGQLRRRIHDLLAVVEDKQHSPRAEVVGYHVAQWAGRVIAQLQAGAHDVDQQKPVVDLFAATEGWSPAR